MGLGLYRPHLGSKYCRQNKGSTLKKYDSLSTYFLSFRTNRVHYFSVHHFPWTDLTKNLVSRYNSLSNIARLSFWISLVRLPPFSPEAWPRRYHIVCRLSSNLQHSFAAQKTCRLSHCTLRDRVLLHLSGVSTTETKSSIRYEYNCTPFLQPR